MLTFKKWAAIAVATLVVLAASLILWWPPSSASDVAAWAQAVTTAAALIVALGLPLYQHDRDQRLKLAEEARLRAIQLEAALQLGAAVAAVCAKVIDGCVNERGSRVYFTNALGEVRAVRSMLGKFDPAFFNGYEELEPAVSVMSAADAMTDLLQHAAERADQHSQNASVRDAFKAIRDELGPKVAQMKATADKARAAAGIR